MTNLTAGVSEAMVEAALKAAPRFWRDTRDCEKYLAKMLTAALAGRVVVPKYPSWEMMIAGRDVIECDDEGASLSTDDACDIYRAMIAAAADGGA